MRIALGVLLFAQTLCSGAIVTINMSTGLGIWTLRDSVANGGALLAEGNSAVNGDGAQVNLGYYSDHATNGVFGGSDATFVKLTGTGSTFGGADVRVLTTSVGDFVANGPGAGQFSIDGLIISDTPANSLMPAAGTPLVLRIFNAPTEAGATYKLELANASLWKWISPAPVSPTISINTDDTSLSLMNAIDRTATPISGGGNINANVAVPEPSALALQAVIAFCGFSGRTRVRRRK